MCVIVCEETGKIPTLDDLKDMRSSNRDGIGIAWRDDGEGCIRFYRDLTMENTWKLMEFIRDHKLAYLLHFRFATQGGRSRELCHPFPITDNKDELFKLKGRANEVLAHNGTWSDWRSHPLARGKLLRDGSDSMFMAYIMAKGYYFTRRSMSWHKIALLSATAGLRLLGDFAKDERGIKYSNMSWRHTYSSYVPPARTPYSPAASYQVRDEKTGRWVTKKYDPDKDKWEVKNTGASSSRAPVVPSNQSVYSDGYEDYWDGMIDGYPHHHGGYSSAPVTRTTIVTGEKLLTSVERQKEAEEVEAELRKGEKKDKKDASKAPAEDINVDSCAIPQNPTPKDEGKDKTLVLKPDEQKRLDKAFTPPAKGGVHASECRCERCVRSPFSATPGGHLVWTTGGWHNRADAHGLGWCKLCSWAIPKSNLDRHQAHCPGRSPEIPRIWCPKGCRWYVIEKFLTSHLTFCKGDKDVRRCMVGCGQAFNWQEIVDHEQLCDGKARSDHWGRLALAVSIYAMQMTQTATEKGAHV